MLIIPLLAVSFLTQAAVLAAPIPLNAVSLNARTPLSDDDAIFSRSDHGDSAPASGTSPNTSTFAWMVSRHFDSTLERFEFIGDQRGGQDVSAPAGTLA